MPVLRAILGIVVCLCSAQEIDAASEIRIAVFKTQPSYMVYLGIAIPKYQNRLSMSIFFYKKTDQACRGRLNRFYNNRLGRYNKLVLALDSGRALPGLAPVTAWGVRRSAPRYAPPARGSA